MATTAQINEKKQLAQRRIEEVHLRKIANIDGEIFLISTAYPGVWLEHAFDGVVYGRLNKNDEDKRKIAENQLLLFIRNQKADGHLPYRVLDPSIGNKNYANSKPVAFSQLQECVSIGSLCLDAYELTGNVDFLKEAFEAVKGWVEWLKQNRMNKDKGLIETYCIYDTGHDRSIRLSGLPNGCPDDEAKTYERNGILPLISPDVNAVFYGNLKALEKMAEILGDADTKQSAEIEAKRIRDNMFEYLYDEADEFFYDIDVTEKMRKIKSVSITNVFSEKLLTQAEFDKIYERYFLSPEHFKAPYPFPSVALSDSKGKPHAEKNDWGYYSQALTALRGQRWMDYYGRGTDYDKLLEKWINVYASQTELMFTQELDPYTGQPTDCSRWYSSAMLTYLYGLSRIG